MFPQSVRDHFLSHHNSYPLFSAVALISGLMHLDHLDQEVIDIVRKKINREQTSDMLKSTVLRLGRLHLYINIILQKESLIDPEKRFSLKARWKETLSVPMDQASPRSPDVLEILQNLGYTNKVLPPVPSVTSIIPAVTCAQGYEMVRQEGLSAIVLEKDGVRFCLEWKSFDRHCYGVICLDDRQAHIVCLQE